jgi:single-stranded DNA-binding protein
MRGLNRVVVSGNVLARVIYAPTTSGTAACSFQLASSRTTPDAVVTAFVKINVYGEQLVALCRQNLVKGVYALVEGELMNREGPHGELTEVRARDLVFFPDSVP